MSIIYEFTAQENYPTVNLDNQLQISFVKGNIGNKIGRTELLEQPGFENISYHENFNKIQKSLNNYLFMSGKIKVTYEWEDTENIDTNTTEKFWEIQSNNPEHPHAATFKESNKCGFTLNYGGYVTSWTNRSLEWELASSTASLEALEDDTEIICVMQQEHGWSFKNVDLKSNEEVNTNKEGELCYLIFGENVEVTINENIYNFNKYDVKQLTSSSCNLKNVSSNTARMIMVYK